MLYTVEVPADHIQPGDLVYFAAWHEEFLPVIGQLTGQGAVVATVPPPRLAPALPVTYVIGSEAQYDGQAPRRGVRMMGEGTVQAVVVTRGADGVVIYGRDNSMAYPARRAYPHHRTKQQAAIRGTGVIFPGHVPPTVIETLWRHKEIIALDNS